MSTPDNALLDVLLQEAQYAEEYQDGDYSAWLEYSETEETRQ